MEKELIYDYMMKDGATADRAVPLLLVARHLERICDHAVSMAEESFTWWKRGSCVIIRWKTAAL